jgi:hypothetical protein
MELYRREITPVHRYIELKTGYADNRAVWIGHAAPQKTGEHSISTGVVYGG